MNFNHITLILLYHAPLTAGSCNLNWEKVVGIATF
jgi:hypothetical protein